MNSEEKRRKNKSGNGRDPLLPRRILTALLMGPLIIFFKRKLSDPLLKKAGA